MARKRIPQLDALTGAASANDDNLVIFDTSTNTTKRILRSQLAIGLVGDLPYTPSGTISATTIPTAIAEVDTEKAPKASPSFTGTVTLGDAVNIALNTATGSKFGTSASQKLGFFNAAPVVQPTAVADLTTTATSGVLPTPNGAVTIADAAAPTVAELLEYCVELEAKVEALALRLRNLGLIAT